MEKIDFEKSETKVNLARAFAGECQDGARYQFVATQAQQEGYTNIQNLLKTFAKNEMAHAKMFFDLINQNCTKKTQNIQITGGYPFECGSLQQNLKDSIQTEISQSENVYPSFAKIAKDEGFLEIAKKFEYVASVENSHHEMLTELLAMLKANKLYKSMDVRVWKCGQCGYMRESKSCWEICPACNMPKGYCQICLKSAKQL